MPHSLFWNSISSTDPTVGANWTREDATTGNIPATGDTVNLIPVPGSVLVGIQAANQSAIALAALNISQAFFPTVGDETIPGGYWQIGATQVNIGIPPTDGSTPSGSGRIKLDIGASAAIVNIFNTGQSSSDPGYEPVRMIGSAIAAVNMYNGRAGFATSAPGETSIITLAGVVGGTLDYGVGVTWTTADVANGGTLNLNSAGTTLTASSGAVVVASGTGAITTVNCGGNILLNNRVGGTDVATLNLFGTGTANYSGNPAASTLGTLNWYSGGTIVTNASNPNHVTVTTTVLKDGGRRTLGA